jgi:hypothetical protein
MNPQSFSICIFCRPGEVYFDTKKELFKVLGGGKLRKASLLKLLNPFHQYWKNLADAKKKVSVVVLA